MPRKPRKDAPGVIHHATIHGVDDEMISRTDEDRIGYRLMLAATAKRFRWNVLLFCQMGTHVHLVVETTEANFAEGMQWLHGQYGRAFNRQYRRPGHLFGGRYHDETVETEAHLINVVGYVAANPVDAHLCRDPRDWPWGSHAAVASGRIPDWLAHGRTVELLSDMGPGAYERIVAARTRY